MAFETYEVANDQGHGMVIFLSHIAFIKNHEGVTRFVMANGHTINFPNVEYEKVADIMRQLPNKTCVAIAGAK